MMTTVWAWILLPFAILNWVVALIGLLLVHTTEYISDQIIAFLE